MYLTMFFTVCPKNQLMAWSCGILRSYGSSDRISPVYRVVVIKIKKQNCKLTDVLNNVIFNKGHSGALTIICFAPITDWHLSQSSFSTSATSSRHLGPILRNRFGRNLRMKHYLVKFRFVIMTLRSFKNTSKSNNIVHNSRTNLHLLFLSRNLSKI
jgi:hypothetical protein